MCSNEEIEEMIESFKQLPDLYQQGILGVIRDRKNLYELQVACCQSKSHLNESYFKTIESTT